MRKTLEVIGKSGCGKTVTARTIMGLIQDFPGVIAGEILFNDGQERKYNLPDGLRSDLEKNENGNIISVKKNNVARLKKVDKKMHPIRGRSLSMVFQEPQTALNPLMTVAQHTDDWSP